MYCVYCASVSVIQCKHLEQLIRKIIVQMDWLTSCSRIRIVIDNYTLTLSLIVVRLTLPIGHAFRNVRSDCIYFVALDRSRKSASVVRTINEPIHKY